MKIILDQALLAESLEKAMRGISKSNKLPILRGIKVDVTEQGIILTASDLDSTISILVFKGEGIEILEKGSTVLPINIAEVIKKLKGKIELSVDDQFCTLKSERAEFESPCWDSDEFPKLPSVKFEPIVTIPGEDFLDLVDKTVGAVGDDSTGMTILEGINIKAEANQISLNATDRQRYHRATLKCSVERPFECTVPKKILIDIAKINKENNPIEVFCDESQFVAKCGQMIYFTRLLEGTYPMVERLIPNDLDISLTIRYNRNDLIESFEQMKVFARERVEKATCFFYLDGLTSILDTKSSNNGAATKGQIGVPCLEVSGNSDIKIRLIIDYVLDSLKSIDEDEVLVHLIASMKPFMIEPKVNNKDKQRSFISMITPMRH